MKFTKRMFSLVLICMLAFSMLPVSVGAISISDGNLTYVIDDSETYAIVVGYEEKLNPITEVVIPEMLYQYPVIGVADNAFVNNTDITSVTFAENSIVKSIDSSAFAFCTSLKTVTIPASVEVIGSEAFLGCTSLETVSVESSKLSVEAYAFSNCTALNSFDTFKITSLGINAFYNTGLKTVKISNKVAEIPEYCFAYCENLTSAVIQGTSTTIASTAFYKEATDLNIISNKNSVASAFADTNGYNSYFLGDADLNGNIRIRDVTNVQMYIARDINLSDIALLACDVNFDGKVNVRDISVIQSYLAQAVTEF